jgi:WD40 repeat protein
LQDHHGCIYDLALSNDGKLLASGGTDKIVRVWKTDTGELITRCSGHEKAINEVAFAPGGRWLVSASDDGTVRTWQIDNGRELQRFRHSDDNLRNVDAMAVSPDGKWIVSGGPQKGIRLWDVPAARLAATFAIHPQESLRLADGRLAYHCVAQCGIRFDHSGERVLSAGASDHTLRIWKRDSGEEVSSMKLGFWPGRFALSENGRRILIAGGDGAVHLWAIPQFEKDPARVRISNYPLEVPPPQ